MGFNETLEFAIKGHQTHLKQWILEVYARQLHSSLFAGFIKEVRKNWNELIHGNFGENLLPN